MINENSLKAAFEKYSLQYGGKKEDYFGLLYLSKEHNEAIDEISRNVVFGNYDFGIDAYCLLMINLK